MEQLRLLFQLIRFVFFAAILYVVLLILVPQRLAYHSTRNLRVPLADYGHTWSRFKEAGEHGPVDVLFLGSSHAYRGFDPRVWAARGYRTFNLGSSGQTPLQSGMLLRRYANGLRPRLVILEVEPNGFASDGVESGIDLLANGPIDADAFQMAWHLQHIKTWHALVYMGIRNMIWGRPEVEEPVVKGMDTYVPGGYVSRTMAYHSPLPPGRPLALSVRPLQMEAFEQLVQKLRADGIPLILVEAPVTTTHRFHFKDHHDHAAMLSGHGTYLDMQGQVPLDDSLHFYDRYHLNQRGVELFNAALIDRLEAGGYLPLP